MDQQDAVSKTPDQVLVQHTMNWFMNRHDQLDHLINLPPTEKLEVTNKDTGEFVEITDEQRPFVLMGISIAREVFREPPFKVESDPVEPEA